MAGRSSPSFTFVHAADLHLDTPFQGIHDLAPQVALALREASLQAFDNIVNLAIERDAALAVFAGDIYDGAERGLRAQLRFRDGLRRLAQHDIKSFVVHGNHDPVTTGWSAIRDSWPQGVTVFGSDAVTVESVQRDGEQIATVQGISYARAATTENLALRYRQPSQPGFHIGLLHCNVAGVATGYSDYSPCSVDDLRASGLDYFALGHIHERRIVHEGTEPGDPWVVYPGNSQARRSRRSEQQPKGAMVVRVENGAVADVEFVPCDIVRFSFVDCLISELSDLGELEDRLRSHASAALDEAEGRAVVLRAELSGRGPLHAELARTGVLRELLVRLREDFAGNGQFCWWDDIHDATQTDIDFDALRGRGDFTSDLLELAEQLLANEDDHQALSDELTASVPRQLAARIELLVGDDEQLHGALQRATALAIDELLRETP